MPPPRFWEFAHLSDDFKNMGWLDPIPRAKGIYIGGLHALYSQPDLFLQHEITHVLSVIDYDVDLQSKAKIEGHGEAEGYRHLLVRVEDDPNEDLLKYFPRTNGFIAEALETGEGVFIHCAMGKSRSATVVCAYLMERYGLDVAEALRWVCEGRPICQPNLGFMEQLETWGRMLKAREKGPAAGSDGDGASGAGQEKEKIYEEWRRSRFKGTWWEWERRAREEKARL